MRTLLLLQADEDLAAIPFAARIAESSGHPLAILCVRRDDDSGLDEVTPGEDSPAPLVRAVLEHFAAGERPAPPIHDCHAPRPGRAVLGAISELEASQLIVPARIGEKASAPASIQRLLRVAPVDVLLIDPGASATPPRRVLLPQIGGGGGHAIRFAARRLGDAQTPVHVLADPAAPVRSQRVYRSSRDRVSAAQQARLTQSEATGRIDDALAPAIREGDLLLLDADETKHLRRILAILGELRRTKPEVDFAVGVTRAADAAGPGRLERTIGRIRLHMPTLSRDERRDVHQFLDRGGRVSAEFVVMLMLSASIAALGLIQSSAAVVIGAMLVAPLMTPLLAIGMALVQGNIQLFRTACRAVAIGVLGALLASMAIGLLSPWSDLSAEVVARGSPNPFDLLIALLSGVAAAFALARPGLAGMLVGVAIAVALVPPIAAAGIATVKGELGIALGAAILFVTNLLAIVLGAAIVFRFFGLDASLRGRRAPRWVATALAIIAVSLVTTTATLVRTLSVQVGQGVHRPYARPLPAAMRRSILDRVAEASGVEILFMAESNIEHGFGREIALACASAIDPALVEDLRAIMAEGEAEGVPVRVLTLRTAPAADGE